jgi:leucyl aminopeptidase
MLNCFVTSADKNAKPIYLVAQKNYPSWLAKQEAYVKNWLSSNGFRGESGNMSLLPDSQGNFVSVVLCVADKNGFWSVGSLPFNLPEDTYYFETTEHNVQQLSIVWGLGAYQFSKYKNPTRKPAKLVLKDNSAYVFNIVESIYLVRDLINIPTDDLGPSEFSIIAKELAELFNAQFSEVIGDALLTENYPMIHAVGRASDDAPRLVEIRWGSGEHPKVTLVGKGVCFDTGGLDLKNSSAMLLMKKDMGGAAHVLGLARMIMSAQLPIQLRVLIPLVENAVSGNAYRPGDVLKTRKGITVEIGNTDAEGRLVLADALTEAVADKPELIIDIATLTGAARIALGTELPALFSNDNSLAQEVVQYSNAQSDPVWQLPLFTAYRDSLNSTIADINNAGSDSYGGAITAALFLKEFVTDDIPWMHFDLMAWNLKTRPGRPAGGEAMALRALFEFLRNKYH